VLTRQWKNTEAAFDIFTDSLTVSQDRQKVTELSKECRWQTKTSKI